MSGPVRPMKLSHANGTATTTPAKVTISRGVGQFISIKNLDGTNDLEISFDSGNTFYSLGPGDTFKSNALFYWFYVQSSAATVDYCTLIASG